MVELISKASKIYQDNFDNITKFERALFLSWYCSKGDCKFCYMSTQKNLIKEPMRARRSFASIFAEAIISKACGWEIEFLSGGYESFDIKELEFIAKNIKEITGKKQWLNIGTLTEDELERFLPYVEGYVGTLECVNPKLRNDICPSKPLSEIKETFKACDKLGIKKAATVIIGLGETIEDFKLLKKFIKENDISRVTFYSLNPQKGTVFKESPTIEYYEQWIAKTRGTFPKLHIVAGAWYNKIDYYGRLLKAGANNFTKFPVLKMFGSKYAKDLLKEIKNADRKYVGELIKLPKIEITKEIEKLDVDDSLKNQIKDKIKSYLSKMKKNS
jgi:biotin synthase-like enzyme